MTCNPLTAVYMGHHDANQQQQTPPVAAHLPSAAHTLNRVGGGYACTVRMQSPVLLLIQGGECGWWLSLMLIRV